MTIPKIFNALQMCSRFCTHMATMPSDFIAPLSLASTGQFAGAGISALPLVMRSLSQPSRQPVVQRMLKRLDYFTTYHPQRMSGAVMLLGTVSQTIGGTGDHTSLWMAASGAFGTFIPLTLVLFGDRRTQGGALSAQDDSLRPIFMRPFFPKRYPMESIVLWGGLETASMLMGARATMQTHDVLMTMGLLGGLGLLLIPDRPAQTEHHPVDTAGLGPANVFGRCVKKAVDWVCEKPTRASAIVMTIGCALPMTVGYLNPGNYNPFMVMAGVAYCLGNYFFGVSTKRETAPPPLPVACRSGACKP